MGISKVRPCVLLFIKSLVSLSELTWLLLHFHDRNNVVLDMPTQIMTAGTKQ